MFLQQSSVRGLLNSKQIHYKRQSVIQNAQGYGVNDGRRLSEKGWLGTGMDFRALAVHNQVHTNHKQWPQILL